MTEIYLHFLGAPYFLIFRNERVHITGFHRWLDDERVVHREQPIRGEGKERPVRARQHKKTTVAFSSIFQLPPRIDLLGDYLHHSVLYINMSRIRVCVYYQS